MDALLEDLLFSFFFFMTVISYRELESMIDRSTYLSFFILRAA